MRALHWWGAAAGAGLLAVSVVAASPAMAGRNDHRPTTKTTTTKKVAKGTTYATDRGRVSVKVVRHGNRPGRGWHDGDGRGRQCPYPPNGTPSISVSGPVALRAGSSAVYAGKVSVNRCSYGNVATAVYISHDGHTDWHKVGEATTTDDGSVAYGIEAHAAGKLYVRIVVAGAGGLSPAQSDDWTVDVWSGRKH